MEAMKYNLDITELKEVRLPNNSPHETMNLTIEKGKMTTVLEMTFNEEGS
jgi:hypothetical protein